MKAILLLFTCLVTVSFCKADSWTRKTDFPLGGRDRAWGFAIGNKAYVGGGIDSAGSRNDVWEYDPGADTWTQKANPPFSLSNWPAGIAVGGYGYIFTDSNQFWQYNPITDSWIRKSDMPGAIRFYPSNFVIGNKIYFGGGLVSPAFDSSFFCYDPATDVWTRIANMPYSILEGSGFTAQNKGFITGLVPEPSNMISPNVLAYDPVADTWAQKASFPDSPRTDASAFTVGYIGYFGIGDMDAGGQFNDWWQYDAYTDSWTKKKSIPCAAGKDENVALTVNNKGYIFFGTDLHFNAEVWEYTPDSLSTYVPDSSLLIKGMPTLFPQATMYPNPTTATLTIQSTNELINQTTITNLLGQTVYTHQYNTTQAEVDVSALPAGIYFIKVNGAEVRKFVKK